MGLLKKYFNQTRKPEGKLGRLMISGMNSGHAKLTDWGFTQLPEIPVKKAVDLGCGGGRSVSLLLEKFPGSHVTGVDYSPLSVDKAREYNRDEIDAGCCTIMQGLFLLLICRRKLMNLLRRLKRSISGPDSTGVSARWPVS